MKAYTFNLNNQIHVHLTDLGVEHWRSHHRELAEQNRERFPDCEFVITESIQPSDVGPGWYQFSAWRFAHVFGPIMTMGRADRYIANMNVKLDAVE